MARNFEQFDKLKINGKNYDRSRCSIAISGLDLATTDLTDFIKDIRYSEEYEKEFDYSLGSPRPTGVAYGNITGSGNMVLSTAGSKLLNDLAKNAGLPSLLYIGQINPVNITIEYVNYDNTVTTDILQTIHPTGSGERGVSTDNLIESRDIGLVIGRVAYDQ